MNVLRDFMHIQYIKGIVVTKHQLIISWLTFIEVYVEFDQSIVKILIYYKILVLFRLFFWTSALKIRQKKGDTQIALWILKWLYYDFQRYSSSHGLKYQTNGENESFETKKIG